MQPVRIQRRRTAGYSMQVVSRATNGLDCISATRPGRLGNPYDVKVVGRELSMALFRNSLECLWDPTLLDGESDDLCEAGYAAHLNFMKRFREDPPLTVARTELRGHNLSCFCRSEDPCHSEILLEIANQ